MFLGPATAAHIPPPPVFLTWPPPVYSCSRQYIVTWREGERGGAHGALSVFTLSPVVQLHIAPDFGMLIMDIGDDVYFPIISAWGI